MPRTARRAAVALGLTAAVVLTSTACSARRIDPAETGSVNIDGTTWQRFCDGPNAVIWVPGRGGDADELEAYVYDHHACAPAFYGEDPPPTTDRPADDDGISEED